MDTSQRKWLFISIGFSLLVLIVILFFTINENTLTYIKEINPLFLLLAFMTHVLTMCFWALRVQKMSGSLGYRIGFFYSLNLVFANLLAAAMTPAQAGGEPIQPGYRCRGEVVPARRATVAQGIYVIENRVSSPSVHRILLCEIIYIPVGIDRLTGARPPRRLSREDSIHKLTHGSSHDFVGEGAALREVEADVGIHRADEGCRVGF